MIKQNVGHLAEEDKFEFSHINPISVWNEINRLNNAKTTSGEVPINSLKMVSDLCYQEITHHMNKSIESCEFPDKLKKADVSPIFKNDDGTNKKNFRPISVLSTLSKVFERQISQQMTPFAKSKISRLLCGFREGHSAQHALFRLIEKCRKCLDDGGVVGMVLMDLSKAFDCLPYDLLIAKLEAYGFGMKCLRFIHSYLSGRKQRVKIGSTFTDWLDIVSGVPQGSVLGPLLFNIYVNDLIYFIQNTEICNFADDNTIYSCGNNLDRIIIDLEEDLCQALEWFESNRLVATPSKFQMMLLGIKRNDKLCMEINGATVCPSASVKLLGITIDAGLKFDQHVKTLCQKVNKNIKAFSRVANLLDLDKAKLLYNSFLLSNFNYCPLIWIFCGKQCNKEINRVHERALRVLLGDYESTFECLLTKNNEIAIHTKNLQKLMTEVYKSLNQGSPSFMGEFFVQRELTYDLRIKNTLQIPPTKTISFGIKSLAFRGSILWNSMPDTIKSVENVFRFKKGIKAWNGDKCSCNICK